MSRITLILCVLLAGVFVFPSWADTIYVNPGDSIQAVLDGAPPGSEIVLMPGLYTGSTCRNLGVNNKSLTIRGTDPEDPSVVAATIIDCEEASFFLRIMGPVDGMSVISGFTIRNAYYLGEGGALNVQNTEAEISYMRFEGNTAYAGGAISTEECMLTVSQSVFSDNAAFASGSPDPHGGAIDSYHSDTTIVQCQFTGNSASVMGDTDWSKGGAICLVGANLILVECELQGNSAGALNGTPWGGGVYAYVDEDQEVLIMNTIIADNHAGRSGPGTLGHGGGLFLTHGSTVGSARLVNCLITDNIGDYRGGGICTGVPTTLKSCTIANNSCPYAGGTGGGVLGWSDDADIVMDNCLVWGNSASTGAQLAAGADAYAGTMNVRYCDVQGGQAAVHVPAGASLSWGAGNINANPLFLDGANGDYHLGAQSPCIDAGTSEAMPGEDYDGQLRWDDPAHANSGGGALPYFEIGAYELADADGDLLGDPAETGTMVFVDVFDAGTYPDDPDSDDDGIPDGEEVHVLGTNPCEADSDGDGRDDGQELLDETNPVHPDNVEKTYYVDGAVGNDGYDGLAAAFDGVHGPKLTVQGGLDATIAGWGYTVLVADGTYGGEGNRDLSFGGKDVTLRSDGGAEVCTLDGTDGMRIIKFEDGETDSTILDGFTLINAGSEDDDGGAIFCVDASPIIRHCVFRYNFAGGGAGIACDEASPTISDCLFEDNEADSEGGAIACYGGSEPLIQDCRILDNIAGGVSGGIHCSESSPRILRCTIAGNEAEGSYGGGLSCNGEGASPYIQDCIIAGNQSSAVGGGVMCDVGSAPTLVNVRITGNSTAYDGGGFYVVDGTPTLVNCTISANAAASWSTGVYCYSGSTTIVNSIITANTGSQIYADPSVLTISHSTVEGGWTGTAVLDADPGFADPDGPDDLADTWEDNDFSITAGSPCIDAGNNNTVPVDVVQDLAGDLRFQDDTGMPDTGVGAPPIVDHGCYEFGGTTLQLGDLNCDGVVDIDDVEPFVLAILDPVAYGDTYPACDRMLADCMDDGSVDGRDVAAFVDLLIGG